MDHTTIRHKLSEYIDGALTPGEKAVIEQHLKTCSECSDALRELRKTIEHIHAIEEVESPAWMTQKIMAKVRTDAEEKKSFFHRLFYPLAVKLPIQTAAVLFLAVTAYYLYNSIDPAQKYAEEPVGMPANKEAPAAGRMTEESKAFREASPEAKQDSRKPGYKSLDMKYSYEKPAEPVPQDRTVASTPAPEKEADRPTVSGEVNATGKSVAARKSAAPMMAEQAAPTAGAVQRTEVKREAVTEEHTAKDALSADKDADAVLDVTEHFVKIDLSETMKKKGLQYHARKFESGLADLRWMQETNAYRSKPCTDRYVVDVDLSGKSSKYLYCYDRSRITLLGVYERKEGIWSEIK